MKHQKHKKFHKSSKCSKLHRTVNKFRTSVLCPLKYQSMARFGIRIRTLGKTAPALAGKFVTRTNGVSPKRDISWRLRRRLYLHCWASPRLWHFVKHVSNIPLALGLFCTYSGPIFITAPYVKKQNNITEGTPHIVQRDDQSNIFSVSCRIANMSYQLIEARQVRLESLAELSSKYSLNA